MKRAKGRPLVVTALIVGSVVLVLLAIAAAILVTQKHSDRIVDCVPGFHNISGPASDCVPNTPTGVP